MPEAPLPVRDGLNPTRLRLPENPSWETIAEFLLTRFPNDATRIAEKIESGEVVVQDGTAVTFSTPYVPREFVYLYRDPPAEPRVPFEIDVLHRDENLLVVDKPHFLATTPRGSWVTETAVVRLRKELDLPELSPVHRLDRLTAGVLVFTVRREARRAYQMLFDRRLVEKEYEAIAPAAPRLDFPREVRSRIVKERGVLQAREVDGPVNAVTSIDVVDTAGDRARYRLRPETGRTHQLRVHMNSLGIPILGDNLYPEVYEVGPQDYSNPLQLLARSLSFHDPITGRPTRFVSRRNLAAWSNSTPGPR
ncbi:tRNA pseudouridine32 synthase / 23S rRNA pseudouridine746 synthase [Rhodococcus rhodochrous J3]|uniref:RNA pseudouridylate synthase n=2 Tax=Rhodococcus rhodochrous TaxID=1829 RepID=A0AA46WXW2_RHORH|nr:MULTISPECIES: pseudouridine synthase [Rhodococcus]AYA25205.1 pseudouridine synthase [Rhodococcus rhodochrous]MBF4478765.1 pseudouridine synthase [Rhodococcus rhodochrous]MCB8909532.1 pseudouridine synthase [Rhodococcus rhodochrous]MCD2098262.1 pseudouridine synthase [Rhodococcus rhodochrous]MCD2122469.1 pseudouridine synthase [Rhodococcus rhodochrous]